MRRYGVQQGFGERNERMRSTATRNLWVLAMLPALIVCAACGQSGGNSSATSAAGSGQAIPDGPIKLGLSTPLSGPLALYGKVIEQTDQAAVNYVNSALGGIDGHKIQLITVDDQNNATTAVQVAEQLVSDHVAGVIGDGIDPLDLQEAPVFDKAHIPAVTFNAVSPASSYPYIFSDSADNSLVAGVAAKLIKTQNLSPIAFISDGAPSAADQISDIIKELGTASPQIKVVGNETVPATSLDITATLSKMRSAGAKVVFFYFSSQVEGPFFKGLQTLGWSPKLIATDAVYYIGFNTIGNLGQGGYTICATGANTSLSSGLVGLIQQDMKISPGPQQVLEARENLANILALKYGIEKAKTLSGPSVRTAIETMTNQSLGAGDWKYTYTSTQHNGYLSFNVCRLMPLGRFMSDVAMPDAIWGGTGAQP
jgi:ABC-type branched-subunit amino acid transport system substrate-binding protein